LPLVALCSKEEEQEAVVWSGKAAAQGSSGAQFNLGVLYENGRGTKVDFAKANEWYRKASVQGDALAIGNLGMLYVRGQGVKENKTAGAALLLVSATQPMFNNSVYNSLTISELHFALALHISEFNLNSLIINGLNYLRIFYALHRVPKNSTRLFTMSYILNMAKNSYC
jgi:TPR repeat protein